MKDLGTRESPDSAINYITGRSNGEDKDVTLLGSHGVPVGSLSDLDSTAENAIAWLNLAARISTRIEKPFRHLVISFEDGDCNISDDLLLNVAVRLLKKMGYGDSAYYIARHSEKNNAHVHILVCRLDHTGSLVNEANLHRRIVDECRTLKTEYGFSWGYHKTISTVADFHNRKEECRYYLARMIFNSLQKISKIEELPRELALQSGGRAVAEIGEYKTKTGEKKNYIQYYVIDPAKEKTYSFRDRWLDLHLSYAHLEVALSYRNRMKEIEKKSEEMIHKYDFARDNFHGIPDCSNEICELKLCWQLISSIKEKMQTDSRKFTKEQVDLEVAILYSYQLVRLLNLLARKIIAPMQQGKIKPKKSDFEFRKSKNGIVVISEKTNRANDETQAPKAAPHM